MIIGILLVESSTPFKKDMFKQLYSFNGKRMIEYSIEELLPVVDHLLIITNSSCEFTSSIKNVTVLINNIPDRKASIQVGMDYLRYFKVEKVIIHDSARPFVRSEHFSKLLEYPYAQYILKLTNGLFCISDNCSVPRDNYYELCTPIAMDYLVIPGYVPDEFSDVVQCNRKFIEGNQSFLRKITLN